MDVDADLRAYDALSQHPRHADLAAVTRAVLDIIAGDRRAENASERVAELVAEYGLLPEDAVTPFGNVLDVLGRGPEDDAERALARALSALAIGTAPPNAKDDGQTAANLLWLGARTPFDASGLVDHALGPAASSLWTAVAEQIRSIDGGAHTSLGRGEALVGAAALACSMSTAAAGLALALSSEVRDRQLGRILAAVSGADPGQGPEGELGSRPHSPVITALLALSGISLVCRAIRFSLRMALAYRRPARVALLDDGGIRVQWRTEILGRTLREHDVVVPRSALMRATRDVRYPSLALYAGLLALALGSYLGLSALIDGVRVSSPSLLGTGIVIVLVGVGLDLALSSISPGRRSKCRLILVPRRGGALCISGVDIPAADAWLARISRR